jgi:predicted DNA repair protein MutK
MLIQYGRLDPQKATALSTLPSLLFLVREWLAGTLAQLGFVSAFGPVGILHIVLGCILTLAGRRRTVTSDWLARYYSVPLMVLGVAGWLFPETSADDVGIAFETASEKVLWVFLGRSLLSLGALLCTLLFACGDLTTAIRNSTLVTAATTLLDITWIRKTTLKQANFSWPKAIRFTMITFFLAALMFVLPGP